MSHEWEYSERFYEFRGRPLVEGNAISKDIWDTWQPKVFELIRPDLDSGWQIDQSYWGAHRINYETKRINLLSYSGGAWVMYIIIGVVTYGIGFLIAPFFMNRDFMQFKGIEVRLT